MKTKNPKTIDTSSQKQRFIETAKELGCDDDDERCNDTLKKVAKRPARSEGPESDCDAGQGRKPAR